MTEENMKSDPAETKIAWHYIAERMGIHKITPEKLAYSSGSSLDRIQKGIKEGIVDCPTSFLKACLRTFGLTSARDEGNEKAIDYLTRQECIDLLRPPPSMPPMRRNPWEFIDDEWGG